MPTRSIFDLTKNIENLGISAQKIDEQKFI